MVVPGATVSDEYTWISKLFWAAARPLAASIRPKTNSDRALGNIRVLYAKGKRLDRDLALAVAHLECMFVGTAAQYERARRQALANDQLIAVQNHLSVPILWGLWAPWPWF